MNDINDGLDLLISALTPTLDTNAEKSAHSNISNFSSTCWPQIATDGGDTAFGDISEVDDIWDWSTDHLVGLLWPGDCLYGCKDPTAANYGAIQDNQAIPPKFPAAASGDAWCSNGWFASCAIAHHCCSRAHFFCYPILQPPASALTFFRRASTANQVRGTAGMIFLNKASY